ncbi:hypothetical protein SSM1_007 [Synechococcus phage S-SM1]|uniref:Uncharacterized protein n=1 Tax=Synechococcus phage S-SM1 TaxID=444859 RepID=E3SI19_9CAUD|nr:hypothetical protein SSM1_007 [Synechococcus phage S-SM1]ADO97338.1 hypothetical protein SSM1_007 [Synechococcus phage S-SM1]
MLDDVVPFQNVYIPSFHGRSDDLDRSSSLQIERGG